MKKLKVTKETIDTGCYSAPPPYHNKTRHQSWKIGFDAGYSEARQVVLKSVEQERIKLLSSEDRANTINEVLKSMATMIDAAAHTITGLSIK